MDVQPRLRREQARNGRKGVLEILRKEASATLVTNELVCP